jgi:hypothetical protein
LQFATVNDYLRCRCEITVATTDLTNGDCR